MITKIGYVVITGYEYYPFIKLAVNLGRRNFFRNLVSNVSNGVGEISAATAAPANNVVTNTAKKMSDAAIKSIGDTPVSRRTFLQGAPVAALAAKDVANKGIQQAQNTINPINRIANNYKDVRQLGNKLEFGNWALGKLDTGMQTGIAMANKTAPTRALANTAPVQGTANMISEAKDNVGMLNRLAHMFRSDKPITRRQFIRGEMLNPWRSTGMAKTMGNETIGLGKAIMSPVYIV